MGTLIFETGGLWVQSKTSVEDKINAIDVIINRLLDMQLLSIEQVGTQEYMLNDGQVQIRNVYRSPEQIATAITAYERLKQQYVNRYNGRKFRLMDSKNFIGQV